MSELPEEEIVLPIEDNIDLHHFHPKDIPSVVKEYIYEVKKRGYNEVRIIHGKGKGYQRAVVQTILTNHRDVESYKDGGNERGGTGATIVKIKY